MTVIEIFRQALTLSQQERKELIKLLVDSLEIEQETEVSEPEEHRGESLSRLPDEVGPAE